MLHFETRVARWPQFSTSPAFPKVSEVENWCQISHFFVPYCKNWGGGVVGEMSVKITICLRPNVRYTFDGLRSTFVDGSGGLRGKQNLKRMKENLTGRKLWKIELINRKQKTTECSHQTCWTTDHSQGIYTVSGKKGATTWFFAVTLPNPNRSSKFFYRHTQQ